MKTVFIIGEQRSGSNLLRLMLNELPGVCAPHPPHLLDRLMPISSRFGDLHWNECFDELVDAACCLIEHNPVSWRSAPFVRSEIRKCCETRSLMAIYAALMRKEATINRASTWVCKSMQNVRWASQIEAYFSSPFYLYLHRDPRDVYHSFQKTLVGEKHPFHVASRWVELQNQCLALEERVGSKRFHRISYAQLVTESEHTMRSICSFLSIPFEARALEPHLGSEAQRTAAAGSQWENVTLPINLSSLQSHKERHDPDAHRIIELTAGKLMKILNYPLPEAAATPKNQGFSDQELCTFDMLNRRWKDDVKKQAPERERQAMASQEEILMSLKLRLESTAELSTVVP
ncbi:MAG: sulfotransferase [Verrucomicrobiota bacterium]